MGELIAIEGIDGSGKGTQSALLCQTLRQEGARCELLSFPRYRDTQFGARIGDFLNGRFGSLDQVHPFLVTLLFAGDRFESRDVLLKSVAENDYVICDRYVASNVAHQAAKRDGTERQELVQWVDYLEFQLYKLPRPDRTLFLDLPVSTATELIAKKARRTYTDQAADLQEADTSYLQKVHDVYRELSTGTGWIRIDCLQSGQLKSVDEISAAVRQALR